MDTLSSDAVYELCRALADRGEDYGWDVYYKGTQIPAEERNKMLEWDGMAGAWFDAFDFALAMYERIAGETWRY